MTSSNFIHMIPTTYELVDNVSLIHDRHSMKLGFDFRQLRTVRYQGGPPSYTYTTVSDLINQSPASIALCFTTGKGLETLNTAFYAQDSFNVTKNVVVNYGLRYEYSPPLRVGFNISGSDPLWPFHRRPPALQARSQEDGPGCSRALKRQGCSTVLL